MTPDTLRKLREERGLTREELALELNCSASAIVQWELNKRAIPPWVEEKMLSNVQVRFPISDLHALLDFARERGESFEEFLSKAVKDFLEKHRSKTTAPTVIKGPTPANPVALPKPITYSPPEGDSLKVAEL